MVRVSVALMLLAGLVASVCRATDYTSPATVHATFRCPESFATDAVRTAELQDFLDWMHLQHPDWSLPKITGYRLFLLEEFHCNKTIATIQTTKAVH